MRQIFTFLVLKVRLFKQVPSLGLPFLRSRIRVRVRIRVLDNVNFNVIEVMFHKPADTISKVK